MKGRITILLFILMACIRLSAQEFVRNLQVYNYDKMKKILNDLKGNTSAGALKEPSFVELQAFKYLVEIIKGQDYEMATDSLHMSGFDFEYYDGYSIDSRTGEVNYLYKQVEFIFFDFHPGSKTCQNWITLALERKTDIVLVGAIHKPRITSVTFYSVQFPKDSIHLKAIFANASIKKLIFNTTDLGLNTISAEALNLKNNTVSSCFLNKIIKAIVQPCTSDCPKPKDVTGCSEEVLTDFENRYSRSVPLSSKYDCMAPGGAGLLYKLRISRCNIYEKTAVLLKCGSCFN